MLLLLVGLTGRDESNNAALGSIAMADEEHPKGRTEAKKNEAVLTVGMIRVVDKESVVVHED